MTLLYGIAAVLLIWWLSKLFASTNPKVLAKALKGGGGVLSLGVAALLMMRDGGRILPALRHEPAIGIKAGLLALASFVPALFAFRLAPVGAVAALRETSVLIGLVLGGAMLKEALDMRRAIGALLILAGGAMVALFTAG